MKTFVIAVIMQVGMAGGALSATPNLVTTLAECVGRMSAELEHAWLMNDDSRMLEQQRAQLVDVLDAMMARERARTLLSHRIDAKMSQASLLTIATFGSDPVRAAWAKKQSMFYVRRCTGFLLES